MKSCRCTTPLIKVRRCTWWSCCSGPTARPSRPPQRIRRAAMCPHASSARAADAPWLMPGLYAPRYTGRQAAFALRRCEGCIGCIAGSGEAVARDKWPGCREGGCGALPCPSRRPQCRQQCRMVPAPISLAATRLPCCMPRRGYAARRAAQGGKLLPLHHAAKCGAPFEVVELLLEANREAAATLTQARAVVPTRPPPPHAVEALRAPPLTLLSRLARRPRVVPIRRALRARAAQDGKLPLHYATAKDETTLKVVTLLLEANPQAAETADKARQRAHACHRVCCHRIAVSHAPLLHTSLPRPPCAPPMSRARATCCAGQEASAALRR